MIDDPVDTYLGISPCTSYHQLIWWLIQQWLIKQCKVLQFCVRNWACEALLYAILISDLTACTFLHEICPFNIPLLVFIFLSYSFEPRCIIKISNVFQSHGGILWRIEICKINISQQCLIVLTRTIIYHSTKCDAHYENLLRKFSSPGNF